jgi:hypothetical protein
MWATDPERIESSLEVRVVAQWRGASDTAVENDDDQQHQRTTQPPPATANIADMLFASEIQVMLRTP